MKLASIFFAASVSILEIYLKYQKEASEKYEACFNIFYSEREYILS